MIKECCIVGCDTKDIKVSKHLKDGNYYCGRHINQLARYNKITQIKNRITIPKDSKCCFCGSTNENGYLYYFNNNIYCKKHYEHMRLYGFCKERTIFDPNEIVIYENYAEVILYDINNQEKARSLIDIEDVDKIKLFKWNLGSNGYAVNGNNGLCIHNLILNLKDNEIPDHINRNKLDNRKENLRYGSHSNNMMNRGIYSNNTSGITGVSYVKRDNKWRAQLKCKNMLIYENFFEFDSAVKQRLQWEKEYFGEFAPQRHLFQKYGIKPL